MKIQIVNNCRKKYKTNIERVIRKILNKVPDIFLDGFGQVYILDSKEGVHKRISYTQPKKEKSDSKVEIYMENSDFSGIPFFSILAINIYFIMAINEHIERYLKPKTKKKEILSYPTSRTNYSWMYLGIWTPLIVPIRISNFLLFKISIIKKVISLVINKIVKKVENFNE